MIRTFLIGLVAGARSMVPLAAVSAAARLGRLPDDTGALSFLADPRVSTGTVLLAAGELVADKLPSARDRISAPGLAARIASGALAGAALAPRHWRGAAALLGAAAAVGSAYVSYGARMRAMRRFDQVSTGVVEDALAVGSALWIATGASPVRTSAIRSARAVMFA